LHRSSTRSSLTAQKYIPVLQPSPLSTQTHFRNQSFPPTIEQTKQQNLTVTNAAAAAATSAAVSTGAWAALVAAWHTAPHTVLLSLGAFLAGATLSIFLIASIPTIIALRRSIFALTQLLHVMKEEIPDTAAAVRLSTLELADAIEDVSTLGSDLTQGLRASARALIGAEVGMKQGYDLAEKAVNGYVVPGVKKAVPNARQALESALVTRSELGHTEPAIQKVAQATRKTAQRIRGTIAGTRVVGGAAMVGRQLKRVTGGGGGGGREPPREGSPEAVIQQGAT